MDADLDAFDKQVSAHGVKTTRKKDPEPSISEVVSFADPKGTLIEVFKRDAFFHQKFQQKGIVPYKIGHVAFHVTDVEHVTKFYCDVLGFSRVRLDGRFLLVPALRAGPPHHQSDGDRFKPLFQRSICAIGDTCMTFATFLVSTAASCFGARAATESATIFSLTIARPTTSLARHSPSLIA
jgi:Glyoxalase/Bleomycin resistance protein/Dioxygenase superfamily